MTQDFRLLLSRASRTTSRYFSDRAAELDLSVVQAQALIALDADPGMNVGALAAALSKDQASTSILIDKLMTLGLVLRETDPSDRRRANIYVTAQAKPLVSQLETARDDINRLIIDALGRDDSRSLEGLLQQLLDAIEGSEAGRHSGESHAT
jgi:DNA-binding MarR family transcriptional regulator